MAVQFAVECVSSLLRNTQIVFAWVNDEGTKRAYERGDDAYRVFRKMLESGHPPDDWNQLLAESRAEVKRFQQLAAGIAS